MERVRQLHSLWGWLPAFRVVAETEHLPSASEQLGITPQALSRSIKLLEEHLGRELFDRVGRGLRLNDDGRDLLEHVRAAMRHLDDGITALSGATLRGAARIAALAHHAWILVVPALERMRREHPALVPHVESVGGTAALEALRRGDVDIAIGEFSSPDPALLFEPLIELRSVVFCGEAHPLARERSVDLDALAAHPFVVPAGNVGDGWPIEQPRTVGARVSSFQLAIELCARGEYLAMLPDAVAPVAPRLHKLPADLSVARPVHVATRAPVGRHQITDTLLDALQRAALAIQQATMSV